MCPVWTQNGAMPKHLKTPCRNSQYIGTEIFKHSLWKFVAENDTEKSQLLWKSILQKNAMLKNFQCYFSVSLSVVFVWHNENDSSVIIRDLI